MNLGQFTGTENYFKSNMFVPKMLHTDGVEYFCKEGGAYWFLDKVALEYSKMQEVHPFMSIKLVVKNDEADIFVEDGNGDALFKQFIPFTDCPEGEYNFFLTDNVLMLTSEY